MPPNRFESEVESFLEGSHGDRTHIKRADHPRLHHYAGRYYRKNGALLNAGYHEYDSIQPFIDKHRSDLCRLGDPGGKFAAAVHKDGTLPSFGERGLFQPFSLGAPDMRARLTEELPEGHIVKYG